MNTPRTAAAVLALALFNAGSARADDPPVPTPRPDQPGDSAPSAPTNNYNQGTTADGRTIVAPGTYGPFQGPTCEAGSAGCSASSANDMAATTNSLLAVGDLQKKEAQAGTPPTVDPAKFADVKKEEDNMKANGIYKDIQRTADGTGAVITLPNGMIAYSDYVKGFDTLPKSPADVLKDPNASAALKAAAQKMLDDQNPDKQQLEAANKKMFGALDVGGSKKTPPQVGSASSVDNTGGDQSKDNVDPTEIGKMLVDIGGLPNGSLSGPGGSTGGSTGRTNGRSAYAADKPESDETSASVQTVTSTGQLDLSHVDVYQMQKNFKDSAAVHALEKSVQATKGGDSSTEDDLHGDATQGSNLFHSAGH